MPRESINDGADEQPKRRRRPMEGSPLQTPIETYLRSIQDMPLLDAQQEKTFAQLLWDVRDDITKEAQRLSAQLPHRMQNIRCKHCSKRAETSRR